MRKPLIHFVAFWFAVPALGQERTESYLGSLAPVIRSIQHSRGFPMDFRRKGALTHEEWRRRGRDLVSQSLSFLPEAVPLDLQIRQTLARDGYEIRVISYAGSGHYRVPAYLLVPTGATRPLPGIVALHDHGGWFLHGKEKLVRMEGEHHALAAFRERYYEGRTYADDLAKRGFVVIVPDAFYWGDRRLQWVDPPTDYLNQIKGLDPRSPEYVQAVNAYLGNAAAVLNTWLGFAGTSWMGIVTHDDRRAVELLSSLKEVDPSRLGCVGLSGGGYRSTYLTGLEPRLKASVIVGWMTSLASNIDMPRPVHRSLFDAPGLHAFLDHPNIASLAAPDCAILVQNCARDSLFTREGMQQAAETIRLVFDATGRPERFDSRFYDVSHQFNRKMQEEAFRWLEQWLKP